ncbi:MAG: TonB-dependent receptor [Betaproteobacteria bacterium]|nr:TonB-dependent receptor [Betaproteobacteria bacterium]
MRTSRNVFARRLSRPANSIKPARSDSAKPPGLRWAAPLVLALAVHAATVCAQDTRIEQLRGMSLNDLLQVDISTGTSKLIHQAPGVAYVITGPDISRMGARNVRDVLESLPGFNIHLFQGIVNAPLVDLRGVVSERGGYLLFLRDGRPLRLLSNNTFPEIFRLPVHFIERIEIMRGPASAVYGADALAGAVNIITKNRPDEAGLRMGEHELAAGWAGLHGQSRWFDWSLAASSTRYDEETPTRRRQPALQFTQNFAQRYSDIDAKLSAGPLKLSLWALNSGKDETGNPANPLGFTTVRTKHRHADIEYGAKLSPTMELKADVFYTYFRGTRFNEIIQGRPVSGDNGEERSTATVSVTESRFANHRMRLIAGLMRERRGNFNPASSTPGAATDRAFRSSRFVSVQDEFAFTENWELTAGVRVDRFDDLGSITSPRAGLVWTVNPRLTAKLLQSRGFRVPGPSTTNTASTRPEDMKNVELALDWRPVPECRAVFNLFRYTTNNLLLSGQPGQQPVSSEGRGGEAEVSWSPTSKVKLDAAMTLLDAENRATGARIAYTPKRSAKASATWRPRDDWSATLRYEGYWDRVRPANDPRPALEDIQLAHATLRHEYSRSVSLMLAVHNLADRRTWVPTLSGANNDDYRLGPRQVFAQVEVRF